MDVETTKRRQVASGSARLAARGPSIIPYGN